MYSFINLKSKNNSFFSQTSFLKELSKFGFSLSLLDLSYSVITLTPRGIAVLGEVGQTLGIFCTLQQVFNQCQQPEGIFILPSSSHHSSLQSHFPQAVH